MLIVFLAVGFGTLFLAHTAPFPFLLERFSPKRSLWRIASRGGPPSVYLTYDDGPNPAATPQLLDALKREGARATFFLIDRHVTPETAPIVKRMFEEGHSVALHSGSRELMILTPQDLAKRLTAFGDRIEQLTGYRPCRAFRPHAGWRSGSMYAGLKSIDYVLIGWSWGLWDWNWYRPRVAEGLVKRLRRKVSPGDIVVMHDGHHVNPNADRRYAVEATAQLVPALRAKGYVFSAICVDDQVTAEVMAAAATEMAD
jgi:peptidoglycan/xylan/chitin deacetylase (PgdA/CDA1 family)